MNQISEFSINQIKQNFTPLTAHSKYQREKDQTVSLSSDSNISKYRCQQCCEYLNDITQVKKRQIMLQYQTQKLMEQIERLNRQNQHLINLQYSHHKANLQKYNPLMYFKQDLQSQLAQSKYMLQLHLLSKSLVGKEQITKPSIIKQTKKQKQSFDQLSKPYNLKKKCEQLLLQNIKLQQKNMIKDKIIQERNLFPLYHYDQRILTLRKNVDYWYRRSQQQSSKLKQSLQEVAKIQKTLKKEVKLMIQQQKTYWQNQFKKISLKLTQNTHFNHNQYLQKISQNSNILIQTEHPSISFSNRIQKMDKIKQKKKPIQQNENNLSLKETQIKSKKTMKQNICQNCQKSARQKLIGKSSKIKDKKGNSSNISSNMDSMNRSDKNEAKYQSIKSERKHHIKNDETYHSDKNQQRYILPDKQLSKERKGRNDGQLQGNRSVLGANFANIQIKVNSRQSNKKMSKGVQRGDCISCQRCANKML